MRFTLVVFVMLAACAKDEGRVRKRDCEAVLAHLTALEKGESDQPMCKYHPDCGGDQAERYGRTCTRVLTRTQADCYLRATSLDDADDCLRRTVFDDELRTGRKTHSKSASHDDDDPWFGGGADSSPLGQMRAIRDDACACKDKDCADRVQERITTWARDNASGSTKPDDQVMKLAMEASECMAKAMSSGYGYGYGYFDAGVPDASPYYFNDPYGWRAGSTGMPACDEYFALVDKLMFCDQYPQSAKDAVRESVASMKRTWGDPTYMSDTVKQSTNDSCRMMIDGTQQAMSAMGCP